MCVCCVFGERAVHRTIQIRRFPASFSPLPSVSLDVSPAPRPFWDDGVEAGPCPVPHFSVIFPFVSRCCKLREMDDIYCKY